MEDGKVRFRWRDYRAGDKQKTMTLAADEFIRRFLTHVPPEGLQRIRYYGLFGNRHRQEKLARCRELLGMIKADLPPTKAEDETKADYRDELQHLTGLSLWECPACHHGRMVCVGVIKPSAVASAIIDTS
jgi:hypothetical protein